MTREPTTVSAPEREGNEAFAQPVDGQPRLELTEISFSGPLPPPAALQHYEQVLPGLAERVVRMAEKTVDQEVEGGRVALDAAIRDTKRGQWLGLFLVLVVLACAMLALYSGYEVFATVLDVGR